MVKARRTVRFLGRVRISRYFYRKIVVYAIELLSRFLLIAPPGTFSTISKCVFHLMIMKKNVLCCAALGALTLVSAKADEIAPMLWYGMMPHPYIAEVQKGAEAAAKDFGIKIDVTVGQEWTQANETQNIEQQSARGYKAISLF